MTSLQDPRLTSDRALAMTNLVLASAQPAAAYVTRLTGRGVSEAERSRKLSGPVTPAEGTFAIWLPLFLTSVVHGARIALRPPQDQPLPRTNWLMSAAYSCNAAWSLQAQLRGLGWTSVSIILASATTASTALILAERESEHSPESRNTANAVAPLAGWLTLATFANTEATLNGVFGRPARREETVRSVALLLAATLTAGTIATAARGNRLYTAAVAWGLGGVVLRNVRERKVAVAIAAGLGCAAALAATVFGGRRSARAAA